MKDENGALLDSQPPEGAVELIAIVDGQEVGRLGLTVHWQHADVCAHAAPTPGLGVALMRQDPVQPRFEGVGVAQRPELTPGSDERGLHRVISHVGVTQDPVRNRHAPIADRAGEGIEGLSVAPFRAVNERSRHPTFPSPPSDDRSGWSRSH